MQCFLATSNWLPRQNKFNQCPDQNPAAQQCQIIHETMSPRIRTQSTRSRVTEKCAAEYVHNSALQKNKILQCRKMRFCNAEFKFERMYLAKRVQRKNLHCRKRKSAVQKHELLQCRNCKFCNAQGLQRTLPDSDAITNLAHNCSMSRPSDTDVVLSRRVHNHPRYPSIGVTRIVGAFKAHHTK